MTFTFLLCVIASVNDSAGKFFKHPFTLIFSFIMMMTCVCYIALRKDLRMKVPINYALLGGATLGEAAFLSATAADLTVFSVFTAIMATCLACVGLFVAALKTASSMNREVLIRRMAYSMVAAFCLNLFMLFFLLFFMDFKDKALVFGTSCVMVVLAGVYIMFALLFIIVPGI